MTTRTTRQATAASIAFAQGSQHGLNKADLDAYMASLLSGMPLIEDQQNAVLFQLLAADMTLTTDQAFSVRPGVRTDFTNFIIGGFTFIRKTGAYGTACVGGVYSAAAKAGNAWVANSQSFAALTGAAKIVKATLAAIAGTEYAVNAPILSLSTGNTGALTCDVFCYGHIVD